MDWRGPCWQPHAHAHTSDSPMPLRAFGPLASSQWPCTKATRHTERNTVAVNALPAMSRRNR
eukprot:5115814-Lingulodinium_polyedra.AAC.1